MRANIPDPYDPPLPEQWFAGYAKRRRYAKKVVDIPGAYTAVSALASLFMHIGRFGSRVRMVARDASHEISVRTKQKETTGNPVDYGSGFGMNDEVEEFGYQQYILNDLRAGSRSKHKPILDRGFEAVDGLIQSLEISRVVNFGVALAYMDDRLAARYPDIEFVGIDRAPSVKRFNDEQYNRPNLSFVAADINQWIDEQDDLDGALFVDMRVLFALPESFVRDYFAKLYKRGAAAIYCLEEYGIPRETDAFYQLSYQYKPSVLYRGEIMIHNYPEIIATAGFEVIKAEFFDTHWHDQDKRTFTLFARR